MRKYALIFIFLPFAGLTVEGGFMLKGDQWTDVVHLKSASGLCSGALIKSKWVITAAHCIDQKGQVVDVYSGLEAENKVSTATVQFIDPRYDNKNYNYDVAVLKLDQSAQKSSGYQVTGSKIYHHLLNGQYPPREVLVAGYGLDENNQLGSRKGAFEKRLGLYPGKSYIGSFFTLNSIGKTRSGDSGGPVFILTPEGHQLFGVVSGENSYVIKDDDGDFQENAVRNAPIASSLCVAPADLQKGLGFNHGYCPDIKTAEQKLSVQPQNKEAHLWQAALSVASPLREVETIRNDVFRRVAISFSQMDSLMARKYIKDHLDIIFTERETIKIIRDALNRYENRERSDKYTTGAVSKMKDSAYSLNTRIALRKSKTDVLMGRCGSEPCIEAWRTSYPNPGTVKQFSDHNLNWDFLTSVTVSDSKFKISSLVCLCHSNQGKNNLNKIIEKIEAIGLSKENLGTIDLENGFEIKGKSSKSNIRMICESFQYKGQNNRTIHVNLSLDKNIDVSDLNSLTSNLNRATSKNSLTKDYMSPGSFSFTNPKNYNNFSQENRLLTVNIDEVQGAQSVMINEVFQCQ